MLTFRAMNTDISVFANANVAYDVARVFADAEQRFSRFRQDSELSILNRADQPIEVSAPMFDALAAARRYVELTGGIFDPAIGRSLIALGYDKSFDRGLDRDSEHATPEPATFMDVELDAERRMVHRPANIVIDLGGMIKGRTVDQAATLLPKRGAIDAGGDAVLRAGSPVGWLVEIEDPRDPERTIASFRVRDGAVATSAANRRKWRVANAVRHHLVDPRTRYSAATDLLQTTIVAPTAELADVLAKTVFVLGAEAGAAFLARRNDVGAVLVPGIGEPIVVGRLELV